MDRIRPDRTFLLVPGCLVALAIAVAALLSRNPGPVRQLRDQVRLRMGKVPYPFDYRRFDRALWHTCAGDGNVDNPRGMMVYDLVDTRIQPGLTVSDTISLLGLPDWRGDGVVGVTSVRYATSYTLVQHHLARDYTLPTFLV